MTGPGWNKLIEPLIAKAKEEGVKISQIKEKFGGLRFYVDDCSPEFSKMIDEAEKQSYYICERCGNPGKLRRRSWLKTLCEKCND